jgi:multisubunit Na+/H+ antiporter MnhG subunit
MKQLKIHTSSKNNKVDRLVSAVFGMFFIGIAIATVFLSPSINLIGKYIFVFMIGGLGAEALFSAVRNRKSLLSRIGPLP